MRLVCLRILAFSVSLLVIAGARAGAWLESQRKEKSFWAAPSPIRSALTMQTGALPRFPPTKNSS
jgi:hypothetical protein